MKTGKEMNMSVGQSMLFLWLSLVFVIAIYLFVFVIANCLFLNVVISLLVLKSRAPESKAFWIHVPAREVNQGRTQVDLVSEDQTATSYQNTVNEERIKLCIRSLISLVFMFSNLWCPRSANTMIRTSSGGSRSLWRKMGLNVRNVFCVTKCWRRRRRSHRS